MILVDTDVILDVALNREPHVKASAALLDRLERGPVGGFVAWHTLSNLYYMLGSSGRGGDARGFLMELTGFLRVAPPDTEGFHLAAALPIADLEDAMQVAAAQACGARYIATRNGRDFRGSPVPALTPESALEELG